MLIPAPSSAQPRQGEPPVPIADNVATAARLFAEPGDGEGKATARRLFAEAAKAGRVDARFMLGVMWLSGLGGERDDTEGQKWVMLAALSGHGPAAALLGRLYLDGRGLPRDPGWAFYWAEVGLGRPDLSAEQRAEATRVKDAAAKELTPGQRRVLAASLPSGAAKAVP